MYHKILIPTDGSLNSKRAGKHTAKLVDPQGQIIILHVTEGYNLQTGVLPISTLPNPNETLFEELEIEGKQILEELKEEIIKEDPVNGKDIKFTSIIREGKPYLEILKIMEEKDVDLVVMGASGRHGIDRVILGSVTERVVRESGKPLMIIP